MKKLAFSYGTSVPFCDDSTIKLLCGLSPATVVDVGAGAGKYGKICRELFGDSVHLTAVEGCPITCEYLKKKGVYNVVDNMLIKQWLDKRLREQKQKVDLVICGDVLEHLTRKQCFRAINAFLRIAETVLVVVPLRNVIQEEQDKNPLEVHNAYLLDSDFEKRYIIGEKHSIMAHGLHMFSAWILARKRNRITDRIKTMLLKWGGHKMYLLLSKLHINTSVESDYYIWGIDEKRLGKRS